jgi:hypothetical protein
LGDRHEDKSSPFASERSINMVNRNLEELLRTPAVKDQLIAHLEYLEPEKARELIKILLWSDSAFSFGMLGQLSRSLNFTVAFFDELGQQLQKIPPHLLREFAAEMIRTVDLESIRALPRAYAPLLVTLNLAAGEGPEEIRQNQERKIRLLQEAIRAADFGKIRKGLTKQAEVNYPVIESVVATMVSDPVIFANLINILPPLLNNLLKGTARTLEVIDFPPEILASAVFNLIDKLDAEELGAIINNLSSLINKLHEGSAVLGQPEPRFRSVMQSFLEKGLLNLDEKEAAAALTALGEDLEVLCRAISDTVVQKPELLEEICPALLQGLGAGMRGLTYMLEQLDNLPSKSLPNLTRGLESSVFTEGPKLVNALTVLGNRIMAENPVFLEKVLGELSQSLDRAETAKILNSCLLSYNRRLTEEQDQLKGKGSLYLEQLDQEELSRALLLTSGRLSETLAGNPRLSRVLLKSFFRILGGAIRGALKGGRRMPGRQT